MDNVLFMKKNYVYYIFLVLVLFSCLKQDYGTIDIIDEIEITGDSSFVIRAKVTSDGGSSLYSKGICISSINESPSIGDTLISDSSRNLNFVVEFKGIDLTKSYYIRPYVINRLGVGYGEAIQFTLNSNSNSGLTFANTSVNNITSTSATLNGSSTLASGTPSISERGFVYSQNPSPTVNNTKIIEYSSSTYMSENITGLTPSTTFYVRAYAVNSQGTFYSNEVSFTTGNGYVSFGNTSISNVTASTASLSGSSTLASGTPSISERGFVYSQNPSPTVNNTKIIEYSSSSSMLENITSLTPSTTYYVRAYAVNSQGTFYSNEVSFTTGNGYVSFGNTSVSNVTTSTARFYGSTILASGTPLFSERGFVYSQSPSPTVNNSKVIEYSTSSSMLEDITGLAPSTTYYVRAYAINSQGVFYSNEVSFATDNLPTSPPTLFAPTNGSNLPCCYFSLQWIGTTNVTKYIVQASSNSNFSGVISSWPSSSGGLIPDGRVMQGESTFSNIFTNTGTSSANGTYYWRVKVLYTNGLESQWSSIWFFVYSY